MSDNKALERAKEVYDLVICTLNSRGWQFDEDEENLVVRLSVNGKGQSIPLTFIVDPQSQLLLLYSAMPFFVTENEEAYVKAICQTNYRLADGRFVTDFADGAGAFLMSCCYRQNLIGEEVVSYLIDFTFVVVAKYRDKLRDLSEGKIDLKEYFGFLYN